jgi:hypothetical protein
MARGSLFDRPLRRDWVLRVWTALVLILLFGALNQNTTWSGSVDAHRVASFTGEAIAIVGITFLLLALVPAFVRRVFRSSHQTKPAGDASPSKGSEGLTTGEGRLRAGTPPPRFADISVDGNPAATGLTTRITWDAPGADTVTVDGCEGFPARGTYEVQLTESRKISVVARNAGGATRASTGHIVFLSVPEIAKVSLPQGPGFTMRQTVHLIAEGHTRPMQRLDEILRSHDMLRAALQPPPAAPGIANLAGLAHLAFDTSWARKPAASSDPLVEDAMSQKHPQNPARADDEVPQ